LTNATTPQAPGPRGRKKSKDPLLENIKELGVTQLPQEPAAEEPVSNIHCLTIVGQIEGHLLLPPQNKTTKYEHVIPQLIAVEQNSQIEGLLIILNTVGGDVEAGLAIAEMIDGLSKPTVSIVLGGGHSIGVPIAVAADYSFIAETATMTIHPIRLTGLVIGVPQTYEYLDKMQDRVIRVPQTYEYLDKMQDRVINFIEKHSRITTEKLRELMFQTGDLARDIGTVLVGVDAVNAGLIDEVGSLSPAVKKLNELIALRKKGGNNLQ